MSSDSGSASSLDSSTGSESGYFPPLTSARDFNRGNYPRARFDDGLAFAVKELARQRAPNEQSRLDHEAGIAGELGFSGYQQCAFNKTIYPGYQGDDGHDLVAEIGGRSYEIEVKTAFYGSTELRVPEEQVCHADYFVLCRTSSPREMVELIGYVNRDQLKMRSKCYSGDDCLRVGPEDLETFEPLFISPDRIREAQVST
jgi:hypothetical protein